MEDNGSSVAARVVICWETDCTHTILPPPGLHPGCRDCRQTVDVLTVENHNHHHCASARGH